MAHSSTAALRREAQRLAQQHPPQLLPFQNRKCLFPLFPPPKTKRSCSSAWPQDKYAPILHGFFSQLCSKHIPGKQSRSETDHGVKSPSASPAPRCHHLWWCEMREMRCSSTARADGTLLRGFANGSDVSKEVPGLQLAVGVNKVTSEATSATAVKTPSSSSPLLPRPMHV